MFKTINISFITILFLLNFSKSVYSEIINNIEIKGNERIPTETILMFSQVGIGQDLKINDLNEVLKNLYETNFFKDVSLKFEKNKLLILVEENPIIESVTYNGIKSKTLKEEITKNLKLKSRSSYNEILLNDDKKAILSSLKDSGYYFAKLDIDLVSIENNKVDLVFNIALGNKSKIKKITFIGNKIFKDNKLRSLIISEEYKFWKFISGKKYLNENIIKFDRRLLKNFYQNKGYYDVKINSSFAKLIKDDEFELVFNIDAKNKFNFGELKLKLPIDFNEQNFINLKETLNNLSNTPYSINSVDEIINKLDEIATLEEYQTIKASVKEEITDNVINLTFHIEETEKIFVEKINIFGNNITRENVIRNQFYIDEGDPYNEILTTRTINEIRSLNFFKEVDYEVVEGKQDKSKIINISVEEKPTGEITAGAGFGTSGEVIEFGVRENNYLGKGLGVTSNLSLSSDKITGIFAVENPNFNNTDKSINFSVLANETDKLKNFGYKSKKVGSSIGTDFEFLDDLRLGLTTSTFLEDISTSSTASARQKKQKGSYFDTYLKFDINYDKRNQKYKTNDGYLSIYSVDLPIISDTNTLTNFYNYKIFSELYENNISSFSLSLSSANSLTDDDVKLSERLYIPQRKLRGFVSGKIGPKDGSDYIGGNYYSIMNINSTLPQILPNSQDIEVGTFIDIANLWGVDDDTLSDGSKIRSAFGIGVDWYTPVGPLSFSLAQPITKSSTDKTETFRFNLGTTF
ncbi:outer membrane protein assembly factor BamA [Candidatus Pelagibacter sp.]|uniref:outer membrane protein assembly factor BamA n=1 Tax=Candidatus Pelagibacter sp. TaxID=2024849 RepID=UPI003F8607B2